MGGSKKVLPINIDFTTLADGGLPTSFTGATWTIATAKAINTPTLGTSLWDADASTFEGESTYAWAAYGTNTIANTSNTLVITYVDNAAGAFVPLDDAGDLSANLTNNLFYRLQVDQKINTGSYGINISHGGAYSSVLLSNTDFVTTKLDFRVINQALAEFQLTSMGAGEVVTFDNISIQAITAGDLYAVYNTALKSSVVVKAGITVDQGMLAGVACCLNAVSNPTYGIVAYIDGRQLILSKFINGAYTQLIRKAITYSAGADLEIRKNGTSVMAYYNGSQIGTTQTVSDATVVDNKYCGLFGTAGEVATFSVAVFP